MDNFYVYYQNIQGLWTYDRTMGTEEAANKRVAKLRETYPDAKWQTTTLDGAFY